MRVEIAGRGANARHVHMIGERDLSQRPYDGLENCAATLEGVTIALAFTPERAIQVKHGETRVHLTVEEVVALFDDLTAVLGVTPAQLEAVRRRRGGGTPAHADGADRTVRGLVHGS